VISLSFYVDTAATFKQLVNATIEACGPSRTTKDSDEAGRWAIVGATRKYCLALHVRTFSEVERSFETYIVPLEKECP
jgi:hypothetical protein